MFEKLGIAPVKGQAIVTLLSCKHYGLSCHFELALEIAHP